jgi:hypothetical protein
MQIYHYHPLTAEYLGQGKADPDPLVKGNWLIPAHAVTDAPPTPGKNQAVLYQNGSWILVEDHRGQVVWDTRDRTETVISSPGPMPDNCTTVPPEPFQIWIDGRWQIDPEALAEAEKALVDEEWEAKVQAEIRIMAEERLIARGEKR